MLAPNTALSAKADKRAGAGAPVVEILSADKVFPDGTRALTLGPNGSAVDVCDVLG